MVSNTLEDMIRGCQSKRLLNLALVSTQCGPLFILIPSAKCKHIQRNNFLERKKHLPREISG